MIHHLSAEEPTAKLNLTFDTAFRFLLGLPVPKRPPQERGFENEARFFS
jgi:hypothetical protein